MNYIGDELELFAHAKNWKSYWSQQISSTLSGDILEVGAGIGETTPFLITNSVREITCLEPDPQLFAELSKRPPSKVGRRVCGTLAQLNPQDTFDRIVYIDVLEHIADPQGELKLAAQHLRPNGKIIVLSPAWNFLYSPFDRAVGHVCRFDRQSLSKATPTQLQLERTRYLDCVGLFASLANKVLLRQNLPTLSQIQIWDHWMVRLSRFLDPLFGYRLGKSIFAVWGLK